MKRLAVAFACGALFALGLAISGMTHPSKVLAFLDFTGAWDPSLAFVMGGGVLVNVLLFRVAFRRGTPLLARTFALPDSRDIDARLVGGAAVFGAGWGLGGFCPGPAVVSLAGGATPVIVFVVAMLLGMAVHDRVAGQRSES
jgi:uncharacterized membrane protein YedE/YeeE